MLRKFIISLMALTVTMVMSLLILQPRYNTHTPLYMEELSLDLSKGNIFIINTPTCRIPEVDPFDSSLVHLIKPRPPIHCTYTPQVTYTTDNTLYINYTIVNVTLNRNISCMYQTIRRPSNSDFGVDSGPWVDFSDHVHVQERYIKIKCEYKTNMAFYTNFHSFLVPDNSTEDLLDRKLKEHVKKDNPKEVLNVLMLGIDSVSRINFIRHMPKTRNYILKDLGGIEMSGYTKVADNTFVNIVPMTTGKFVEELPWGKNKKNTFDEYNFIWKNFKEKGYRTFYAEDAPDIAIFHYLKRGFTHPPTYYYNRVLSYAMEREGHLWSNDHNCFAGQLETNIVLKETSDLLHKYRDKPHFAFNFLSRMTHDNFNHVASVDELQLNFLRNVSKDGLLNNTILFYFSDHGSRFGSLRQTFIGKLEERLPLFYIVFPSWFKQKYPGLIKNVTNNGKRLTTPFDVYETLLDLVSFSGVQKSVNISNRGMSLFAKIPKERTCEDADIVPHWCVCLETESLSVSSEHVKDAAEYVVSHLNNILKNNSNVCETLKVAIITRAMQMRPKDQVVDFDFENTPKEKKKERTKFIVQIQLILKTEPGLGVFEATVRLDERKLKNTTTISMVGDVSRINKYGDQSHCVSDSTLKLYCYCKGNT